MSPPRPPAETLALLDTLLASAPVGFAFQDRKFRFVRLNDEMAAINGASVEDHIGRTVPAVASLLRRGLADLRRELE